MALQELEAGEYEWLPSSSCSPRLALPSLAGAGKGAALEASATGDNSSLAGREAAVGISLSAASICAWLRGGTGEMGKKRNTQR